MGNRLLAYTPARGSGGHVAVAGVPGVITTWRLRQRRTHADVTTTGSNLMRARLTTVLDWDFTCESVWDALKITPSVWKTLHSNMIEDGGSIGPIQFDIGETGANYTAATFVLDLCEEINGAEDVVRVRIEGSCNISPLVYNT